MTQPAMVPATAAEAQVYRPLDASLVLRRLNTTPSALWRELEWLRHQDVVAEGEARNVSSGVGREIGCAAGSVLVVPFGFVLAIATGLPIVAVLGFVAGVVLSMVFFFRASTRFSSKKKVAHFDVDNRRYELVFQLISTLWNDLDHQRPMSLQLDLRPSDDAGRRIGETPRGSMKTTHYGSDWLWLTAPMRDGSLFKLVIRERHRVTAGWKTDYSGKLKRKRKEKTKQQLRLTVVLPAKKHPYLERIVGHGRAAVRLPRFVTPVDLACKKGRVTLKATLLEPWTEPMHHRPTPPNMPRCSLAVAMMFMSVYNIAQLSRKVGKRYANRHQGG